jgi:hypothetical protein
MCQEINTKAMNNILLLSTSVNEKFESSQVNVSKYGFCTFFFRKSIPHTTSRPCPTLTVSLSGHDPPRSWLPSAHVPPSSCPSVCCEWQGYVLSLILTKHGAIKAGTEVQLGDHELASGD